jgi:hypothetical protein
LIKSKGTLQHGQTQWPFPFQQTIRKNHNRKALPHPVDFYSQLLFTFVRAFVSALDNGAEM